MEQEFILAMDDDFNTAKAISLLFELNRKVKNTSATMADRISAAIKMVELGSVLGFFQNLEAKLKQEADLEKLQTHLNQLSVIDKALISLVLEGLSMREIADVIGLTEPNVKVKIHRIKEDLKRNMSKYNQNS
mgnify:CR=1 FL=1